MLTVEDIAARTGLHVKTIRRKIREGRFLPPVAFSGRNLWDETVFQEWVRAQHRRPDVADVAVVK
jgi:excisionase family DNA binding protein